MNDFVLGLVVYANYNYGSLPSGDIGSDAKNIC